MPVTLQAILPALKQTLPLLLTTKNELGQGSRPPQENHQRALRGNKQQTVSMTRCFALPSRCRGDDKTADEKCRAVDEMVPQVKSSSNNPVMQRTRRAHKEKEWYAPHNISLASCPSGRRSGWTVRRFDSLVLSEVPDVVLCLCAQGEGAFLCIAP
jgi:hypothetical protein